MPSEKVKTWVDTKIAGKRVVVFSKTHCPYCTMAKDVLKPLVGGELPSEEYEVIEIDSRSDCGEIQDYLLSLTGARSVPRVFINKKCIGGGTETKALQSSGKLSSMIAG